MSISKADIFAKLSGVDILPHVKVSQNIDGDSFPHLPWHSAHTLMMKEYPEYEWAFAENPDGLEVFYFKDGTAEVRVVVTIGTVSVIASKSVTDGFDKAKPNPSADDIHNAKMRCRVRALAELGLGIDLWINPKDYLPKASEEKEEKPAAQQNSEPKEATEQEAMDELFGQVKECKDRKTAMVKKQKVATGWKNRKWNQDELARRWSELCNERKWKNESKTPV